MYFRNRPAVEDFLLGLIDQELAAGRRLALGFDFPFGYPQGFARAVTGESNPLELWTWFAHHIEDSPKSNNRFDVAGLLNRKWGGQGPFWGNGLKRDIAGLPRRKDRYQNPFADRRQVEALTPGTFTCWQMAGAGSVGGQVMMGLPVLHRLRDRFAPHVAVWPFEPADAPVVLMEIWPSLSVLVCPGGWIKDAWQVHSLALDLARRPVSDLIADLSVTAPVEGWILGVPQP